MEFYGIEVLSFVSGLMLPKPALRRMFVCIL